MMKSQIRETVFTNAEPLSPDNLSRALKGLPFKAQMMMRKLAYLEKGSLALQLPDGRRFLLKGKTKGPAAAITLNNWKLPQRAFTGGTIGAAESYMDGDWESEDAGAFMELFLVNENMGSSISNGARGVLRLIERFQHWRNENTRSGSRRNIAAHYDLGNDFYRQWLDPTMTYSSAIYSTGAEDLASAQTAKYRSLAEAAGLRAGDHVLEIGCGWGGFAEFAAGEIGCNVTGLTISREQLDYARERMHRAGLNDRVTLKFQDYRDETGLYDGVVSIEMFEAVGEKYWPAYFSKVEQCLKPGGRAGLQIITIKPESYTYYRDNPDFIQKYVFPGGMLPTREHLASLGRSVNLSLVNDFGFGLDYARTLAEWRERFRAVWERVRPLGFDERFRRLWEFYFFYCEAGFRARNIDVRQVVFAKG